MFLAKDVEELKTHIWYSPPPFFFPENRAFCEILWKNMIEPDRPQITV